MTAKRMFIASAAVTAALVAVIEWTLISSPNLARVSRLPIIVCAITPILMLASAAILLRRVQVRYARVMSLLPVGMMILVVGLHTFNETAYGRAINVQIGNAIYKAFSG